VQWAGVAAMDCDMSAEIENYRRKRDMLIEGLADCYEIARPRGAFYAFPKTPWGTAKEFVDKAINKYQLLIIPGGVFSRRDTNFRVSYAADNSTIERGIEALRKLAREDY
jgi:aspartate/methionine/tyrosine aminotransferase